MSRIPLDLKQECVELTAQGRTAREAYRVFSARHDGMSFETFCRKLRMWKKKAYADDATLHSGTYPGFTAHNATVQVNAAGEITQAWIKQTVDDGQWEELLTAIREHTGPIDVQNSSEDTGVGMLEIPLYDLHFPLCDHRQTLERVLSIVRSRRWEEINIVMGQDLFHNDDFRGRTSSGRPIEKIDIAKAWRLARDFWCCVLSECIKSADAVRVTYSKGNHDESMAWAFVQMLKYAFPGVSFDDSLKQRKAIWWRGCFIGVTHGHSTMSRNGDLRGQFTIEFPELFAAAGVREIHCGHLHHEKEADLYGVMVRRLSQGGATDEWSDDEGYVGAHKRFMVFEWEPYRLAAIHYV